MGKKLQVWKEFVTNNTSLLGLEPVRLLNFGSSFSAAVMVSERIRPHLPRRCPEGNAGLCCPLGVEDKTTMNNTPSSLGDFKLYNIYFITGYYFVWNTHQFSSHHINGLFWLGVKTGVWASGLLCQRGIWYVHGSSNPISAADPGPRDLMCLYQK